MNKQQMCEHINGIISTDSTCGMDVFACVTENGNWVLQKFKCTDGLKAEIRNRILRVIREKFVDEEVELDSIDNIADNKNCLYWIEQSEEYQPFIFVENTDQVTSEFSMSEQVQLKGFVFRFNLNDTCFVAFQKIYGVSFMSPSNNILTFWNKDTYEIMNSDILRISSAVDVIVINRTIIAKNMSVLQNDFGFERKVRSDAAQAIASIEGIGILADSTKLHSFVSKSKLTNAKKFMKVKNSPVMRMDKNVLAEKIKAHKRYSGMFTFDDDNQIIIKSEKDVSKLLAMLNDDYLRSDLTDSEYDSPSKKMLPPADNEE